MAEKVTKIPNQNNINSVIYSQIKNTTDIVGVVINAAINNTINLSSNTIDKLKIYNEVITTLFSNNGAVINIIKIAESFQKLDNKKFSKDSISKGFAILKAMQFHLNEFLSSVSEIKEIPEIDLSNSINIINSINSLRESLDKTDKNKTLIWFKLMRLQHEIKHIVRFIEEIATISINKVSINSAKILLNDIKNTYKDISELFDSFDAIKLKSFASYKIKLIVIKNIIKYILETFSIYEIKTINKINKALGSNTNGLQLLITSMESLVNRLKKSVVSLVSIALMKRIILSGIKSLSEILQKINDKFAKLKPINKTTYKVIDSANECIDKLVNISLKVIALGILSVPVLMAAIFINVLLLPALATIFLSIFMLSKVVTLIEPNIAVGFKNMTSIFASLLVVGLTILGLSLAAPIIMYSIANAILPLLAMLVVSMLIIWASFKLIGKLSVSSIPDILAFGLTISILVATLLSSALIIFIASKLVDELKAGIDKIVLMIAGMLALTAAMVALGIGIAALSPFIISSMIGFGQILGLIGLIIGIGLTINYLAQTKIESEEAQIKTREIISTIKSINKELDDFGTKKEWKNDKKILKQVRKTTKILKNIADDLNVLQSVTIEKDKIITNVTSIMSFTQTLQDLMNKLLFGGNIIDENNTSNSNWASKTLAHIFHKGAAKQVRKEMKYNKKVLNNVDKVINKLVGISEALISVGELKMTPEFQQNITDNVEAIFTFVGMLDAIIFKFMSEGTKDSNDIIDSAKLSKREWKKANKKLSKVEATVATLQGIGDALNVIKDLNLNEVKDEKTGKKVKDVIIDNINAIFNSIDEISKLINEKSITTFDNKNADKLSSIIDYITSLNKGFVDISKADNASIEKNVGNYIKFIDKINTVDIDKLKNSTNMFAQMSRFSESIKGDFDELAESLGDKLLPVLEELREVMNTIPDKLEVGFQNTSASIAATTAPATEENIAKQVNREASNLTPQEIDRIVKIRLSEKAKLDANSTAAKIDELMALLKGFTGDHVSVQIV